MGTAERSKLIGVIDEGTSITRFAIFRLPDFEEICSHELSITQIIPHEGWAEQNPVEILEAVRLCAVEACHKLEQLGYEIRDIASIGLTNQRETTVVWDRKTGEPLYNAIVWDDIRTNSTVDKVLARLPEQNHNHFRSISGLPISPYFSALKLQWLKENVFAVRRACREKRCYAGTIDTWLLWNLTGGVNGGVFVTDVTNASRTLLMNIETLHWDPLLIKTFSLHVDMLPEIRSSSEIYGMIKDGSVLDGIPVSAILGNQQASLVGQQCFREGQAKNTYRKGCFLLYNTGARCVHSTHGLVTTIAYKMGPNKPAVYALEGSVAVAGFAMKWLRDNLGLLKDIPTDSEQIAGSVFSTGDVYFVPAFTGLYAPYWRKDARGIICGLTSFTTKHHIIRAALEAVCFQTRDIIEAMKKDCGINLTKLHADGIMTNNRLLMQLQADLGGIPVLKTEVSDPAAIGTAMAAAQAEGIDLYNMEPGNRDQQFHITHETFLPTTTEEERNARYTKWKMAVQRSLGWAVTKKSEAMTDERYALLASIPASLFLVSSFLMLVFSQSRAR
ncbi:glycerol kinase-like [Wyeomyia smithii]|uniref:glycerol kinase-like n=1 Tax=Wyeomyia smithii TaxID=174621 RepID=UPI002467CA19|nr:glycerol kinase-like [Wyeomyia smithii]XP_055549168.1 glycerol kinase-like [Wyeomyia smithii]XP_055549170.1 glycerol kinase-like [Wyeomyia smithii]XP_055549171.1 glycerol kinase-like [Wyeomyia smithii]